jgi:predicted DsbA family dithiol-disulfide isomerase
MNLRSTLQLAPRQAAAVVAILAVALAAPACAADAPKAAAPAQKAESGADVVAEVAGQPITRAQLEESLAPQLSQLDRQRRALLEQGLDGLVEERLLDAEAAARGIPREALLQAEVESKAGEVTDAEAQAFYQENQARINRPYDQILPQIKQFLAQNKRQELRDRLVSGLRVKHSAKILLEVDRIEVAEAGSPSRGPAGAPVVLIEFSDFECPFCSRVVPAIQQVEKTYGEQVRVVFRQFPLNIHPNAQKAAEAALCADEQGKFWELHDAMFASQRELGVEQLKTKATGLGLDATRFNDCLDSGKLAARVASDLADGQKAGVTGTPAMFVNGRFISGAVPFQTLEKLIDDELSRKGIAPKKAAAE